MSVNLTLSAFDAQGALDNPARVVGPAVDYQPLTLDTELGVMRWMFIGGSGGTVSFVNVNGVVRTNFPVSSGQVFYMLFQQVNTSGTTATDIWVSS